MTDLDQSEISGVEYRIDQSVATITLNAPERKNALSPELVTALADRLDDAMADDGVRVVVLTNRGTTFCAGADLKSSSPGAGDGTGRSRTFVEVFEAIQRGTKPVIGRIDGHATGGGVGLVAVCDISVMRDDAKIGFTEVRIGVAPAIISVVCLPKLSRADATELFLTGERIAPVRAAEVGLINRAVPASELDETVNHFVDQLMLGGPNALAFAKRLIHEVPDMPVAEAFAWTAVHSAALFGEEEAKQGIAAFRNREPAPWVVSRS